MTCRDIDGLIASYASGAPVPPEVAEHIAGCERCRRLTEVMGQSIQVAQPSSEQLKRIENGILADLKPVRPLPPAGVLWSAFLLILVAVVTVGALALGTAGWQALSMLQRITVFAALAAAASALTLSAGRQMVPGTGFRLSPDLLVAAVIGAIIAICATVFHPHEEAAFVSTGLMCLRIGLECAVPAGLLVWLLLGRGAILSPVFTGATAGAMAGLSGLTVLEIFCPNLNRNHILVWHLGAVVASILGGVILGMIAEYSGWRRIAPPRRGGA